MKRLFLMAAVFCLGFSGVALAAVRGDEAMYVGGTPSGIPEKSEGKLDLSDTNAARFTWKKTQVLIPYARTVGRF